MTATPNICRIALGLVAVMATAFFFTRIVPPLPPSAPPIAAVAAGHVANLPRGHALLASNTADIPERPAAITFVAKDYRAPQAPAVTSAPLPVVRSALAGTGQASPDGRQISAEEPATPQLAPPTPEAPVIPREFRLGAMTFELDPGVPLPAALMESASPLPPKLAAAKDDIAREFEREVAEAVAQPETSPSVGQAWPAAKTKADARFRALFGEAAFNEWNMQAAREALPAKPR